MYNTVNRFIKKHSHRLNYEIVWEMGRDHEDINGEEFRTFFRNVLSNKTLSKGSVLIVCLTRASKCPYVPFLQID